ncbi:hypothetical protein [Streptomyces sp. NBC_01497]|uniref:hypothetical protein n=1 Tax=Streptomyces sp. NBC_01497 TaxID=2903885 RepID=UPI002E32DADB|nr:hypothetical protein [Streptomyces sp. NBC_01497]
MSRRERWRAAVLRAGPLLPVLALYAALAGWGVVPPGALPALGVALVVRVGFAYVTAPARAPGTGRCAEVGERDSRHGTEGRGTSCHLRRRTVTGCR